MSDQAAANLPAGANYDESAVRSYSLPELLRLSDGAPVENVQQWLRRRQEIIRLFEDHVFGRSPAYIPAMQISDVATEHALGGIAVRRQLVIAFGEGAPKLNLLIYFPTRAAAALPAVLGPNFLGNHTIDSDPGIRLSDAVFVDGMDVRLPDGPRDATRGTQADRWPLRRIIERGYALATFFYGDVYPDREDGRTLSIQSMFRGTPEDPCSWGAIATWSWAMSRVLDALLEMPEIDPRRVALFGHSRHGKAALWMAALDARFGLVIANNSGKGGASLMRRNFGETIRHLVTRYPHWFTPRYGLYAGRETELPVDQHMLIALAAPRPVYVASAADDLWADPKGEFLAAEAAAPAARLLASTIGYHIRKGGHGVMAEDWERFLDFADMHMR